MELSGFDNDYDIYLISMNHISNIVKLPMYI